MRRLFMVSTQRCREMKGRGRRHVHTKDTRATPYPFIVLWLRLKSELKAPGSVAEA